MSNVLALVEQRSARLADQGDEVVSAAASLAAELGGHAHALVIGGPEAGSHAEALGASGATTVKLALHPRFESYHPDGFAEAAEAVIRAGDYACVLLPATGTGKDLAPRLAARLDVPLAQDVSGLSLSGGTVEVVRPVYAGKALATVRTEGSPVLATLRVSAFPAMTGGASAKVESLEIQPDPDAWPTEIVSFEATAADIPDVAQASIVVAGGRGMKGPEHWGLLERLRAALGNDAGLGASRAVVDAGWRPHGEQVGQTGKTVSPRLYIAVGISGAVQHLAGMKTSGTIVAINRDPDAPIFKVADYGIVGDAFEVVPRLTEEIEESRREG